jgi:hypothetical protein
MSQHTDYKVAVTHAKRVLAKYGDRLSAIIQDDFYWHLFDICDDRYPEWDQT